MTVYLPLLICPLCRRAASRHTSAAQNTFIPIKEKLFPRLLCFGIMLCSFPSVCGRLVLLESLRHAERRGAAEPLALTQTNGRLLGDPADGNIVFLNFGKRGKILNIIQGDRVRFQRIQAVFSVQGIIGKFTGRLGQAARPLTAVLRLKFHAVTSGNFGYRPRCCQKFLITATVFSLSSNLWGSHSVFVI